ncbi:hypothetical protein Mapa_010222 [Marchantia paleacea]|nr:hypothetical protein Mapa_010222 [Marchantia paleacea]
MPPVLALRTTSVQAPLTAMPHLYTLCNRTWRTLLHLRHMRLEKRKLSSVQRANYATVEFNLCIPFSSDSSPKYVCVHVGTNLTLKLI